MAVESPAEFLERVNQVTQTSFDELLSNPDRQWSDDPFQVLYDERNQKAMRQIIRWQGSHIELPEGVMETDWDHQIDMKNIFFQEIVPNCQGITNEIVIDDVHGIIMTHDETEILAGDLWFGVTDPELRERKKHREELAARYFRRHLPEPASSILYSWHRRYVDRNVDDKEALLTKWLDCTQANRYALKHGLYNSIKNIEDRRAHVRGSLEEFLKWSTNVIHAFESTEAKAEFEGLVIQEIQRFIDAGYGTEFFAA